MTRFCNALIIWKKTKGFAVTRLPVNSDGRVSPDDLKKAIRADTILVSDHGGEQ